MTSNGNGDDFSELLSAPPRISIVTGSEALAAEARRLGVGVVTSRHLDKDKIYVVKDPEAFGLFPVRTELSVLPADDPKERTIGWSVHETVGIAAMNPRGVGRLSLDRELVLIETPVLGFPDQRLRAVWTTGRTRVESVRKKGDKDRSTVIGSIDDLGFTPSDDPGSYGLRPSGPQWHDFLAEAERLHVAASVMES